ncbi:alanine--tRNA ligase [Acholeplasma equirhinis]|nr:alanine--tRNA ligase [Acholeplasma equirhinis]
MTSNEIRKMWLDFFKSKGHLVEPSASLIPVDDPTLLWINAGVAPLKKYFDGSETPKSRRITNIQKSIRTNDIENVGKTARHHTFFEMLGNFSIGDYFKEEAIEFGFELLTSKEWFNMPLDKLYMTYYPDDLVAKKTWMRLGVKEDHLIPLETNFWEIGKGPSGPDTEIYFDRGEKYDKRGVELLQNDINNDRYLEIWNIVFSQYNADPSIPRSQYKELPSKNIDTGAGLERFACVLQDTETNFETDLHFPIIKKTSELSGVEYKGQMAFKVISDHIKTLVFAISDGAMLSNEGRGYVLRRLLRRAVKYGRTLGFHEPFLFNLVDTVVEMMGEFYTNLAPTKDIVKKIIQKEEAKFYSTISDGEKHLISSIRNHKISGQDAFKLYDTYGFPIELTVEYAEENHVEVDLDAFKEELNKQKSRSREARNVQASMKAQDEAFLNFNEPSKFVGYETLQHEAKVIKIFDQGIVLDETPFYAKMGGQVADTGTINGLVVKDVQKLPHGQFLHIIETDSFEEGDEVLAIVDETRRIQTTKNHTATHLLHQAIKDVIGKHANQQGSYNGPDKLTFDINHFEAIKHEDILKIEAVVKAKIKESLDVVTHVLPIDEAKKLGAMMLFGEKYGDVVRVVDINKWSIEFCGGTHVKNTKDIEEFAITSVESIGSGIYRFEGTTNHVIESSKDYLASYLGTLEQLLSKKQELTKSTEKDQLPSVLGSYQDILNYREAIVKLQNEVKDLEKKAETDLIASILKDADRFIPSKIEEITYVIVDNLPAASLKPLVDVLYDKIKTEALILINKGEQKASFLVKTSKLVARDLLKDLTTKTNGNGGGKNDFAQGGTQDLTALDTFLKEL